MFKDITIVLMNLEKTMGLTKWENIDQEFMKENKYNELTWWGFKDLWEINRWVKFRDAKYGEGDQYAFKYLSSAKRLINGLGHKISDCTFFKAPNLPLLIQFDEYAIGIAPRIEAE